MALPGQDRIGYAVSELMQRMQIYGTYVLGVYEAFLVRCILLIWLTVQQLGSSLC